MVIWHFERFVCRSLFEHCDGTEGATDFLSTSALQTNFGTHYAHLVSLLYTVSKKKFVQLLKVPKKWQSDYYTCTKSYRDQSGIAKLHPCSERLIKKETKSIDPRIQYFFHVEIWTSKYGFTDTLPRQHVVQTSPLVSDIT
jgi:hypothetical protein